MRKRKRKKVRVQLSVSERAMNTEPMTWAELERLVHRDELSPDVASYRVYLSPLMKARQANLDAVQEAVDGYLAVKGQELLDMPELPDCYTVVSPQLPWRMCVYREGSQVSLRCYYPGERGYDPALDGTLLCDPAEEMLTGQVETDPLGHSTPIDGQNKVLPLMGCRHERDAWLRPSQNRRQLERGP